jgi:shikimate kinase
MNSDAKHNIYLIGPMGSGKTAVGRQLARDAGLVFYDSDLEIQKRTGVDIPYIFEREGERGFREREAEMIEELTRLERALVATGGGAILDERSRQRLAATGIVVYLKAGVEDQLKRTRRSENRPLLAGRDRREVLEQLASVREPLYEGLADITVDTSGQRVKNVAGEVLAQLEAQGLLPLQK